MIWQGFGFLAIFVHPVMAGLMDVLLYRLLGMNSILLFGKADLASLIGVFLGSCALWFGGRWLNSRPVRVLTDPENGERLACRNSHSFFWIPLQYWAILWPLAGLVILFSD
ncbi:MAG: hypothetical protein LBF93_09485 [Zoogloeaceae bacterium]|jgi:hypothetical protein|nr:hypothetical protein [Zoogloeaceae bacterium]